MGISTLNNEVKTKIDINNWTKCLPSQCLHPDKQNTDALLISNSRIRLEAGRTFWQTSLSQYFQGLKVVSDFSLQSDKSYPNRDSVFLPLRIFRPECLMSNSGASILEKLLSDCSLVIIQDADLRLLDLKAHQKFIKSSDITAIDMTTTLGLKGHYSYALLRSNDSGIKFLEGERLW